MSQDIRVLRLICASRTAAATIAAKGRFRSPWNAAPAKTAATRSGERRRQIDPTTCERDYNDDEIEFMKAMDQYKRDNRRPFPTWSEVLEVMRALGYRKVAEQIADAEASVDGHAAEER